MRSPKPSNLARASDRARHRSRSRSVPRVASRPRPLNRQPDDCAADQGCYSTGSTCEDGAPAKPDTCEAGSITCTGRSTSGFSRCSCETGSTTGSPTQHVGGTTLRAHHRNGSTLRSHHRNAAAASHAANQQRATTLDERGTTRGRVYSGVAAWSPGAGRSRAKTLDCFEGM